MITMAKTMLVLFVPSERDEQWAHAQLVAGGFDVSRPIHPAIEYCETEDGEAVPGGGRWFMQEIECRQ